MLQLLVGPALGVETRSPLLPLALAAGEQPERRQRGGYGKSGESHSPLRQPPPPGQPGEEPRAHHRAGRVLGHHGLEPLLEAAGELELLHAGGALDEVLLEPRLLVGRQQALVIALHQAVAFDVGVVHEVRAPRRAALPSRV